MDLEAFAVHKAQAAAEGQVPGPRDSPSYHEAAPGPPNFTDSINPGTGAFTDERARTAVDADGSIKVFTSQMPHGQSHETTYAQVAADELGVGSTTSSSFGGTPIARHSACWAPAVAVAGHSAAGAIRGSSREVRQQVVNSCRVLWRPRPSDIDIVDGNIHVAGVPSKGLSYAEVARLRGGECARPRRSLHRDHQLPRQGRRWLELRHPRLHRGSRSRHRTCRDSPLLGGRGLRARDQPAIVDGQVRGGVAQGIGAVLYENAAYDDEGNLRPARTWTT